MSYESKIGPKVTPDPAREGYCVTSCVDGCYGGCEGSCESSCGQSCEVGGGMSRIVPEGKLK